jgi:cobalamin biosynthetic protein CobC
MRVQLRDEAAALRAVLRRAGLGFSGGTDLFSLVEHPSAVAIHRGLAKRGIWTRAFSRWPNCLRIGLPPGPPELHRFAAALEMVMAEVSQSRE